MLHGQRLTARLPWSINEPSRRAVHAIKEVVMGMFKRSVVLLLPVLISGALPVRAQAPPLKELPKFFGTFSPVVGSWSEYEVI